MTDLTLTFLGSFAVKVDGQPLTRFHSDKVRVLLAYLALEPARPHLRTVLAALLWPEVTDRQALQSLRAALYHLRQSLDQARPGLSQQLLTSTHQAIQFNTEAGLEVTVDALYFQTLVAACEAHLHERLDECESCLNRLKQAANLYRGELLAGFSLEDSFAFEEWLLLQREMLQQQALLTLKNLAEAYETQGEDEQAHRYARQLLRLDPYREGSHRQLMRLLARQGLPDQALAQYASCRQLLADELGAEPEAETTALAEQIRRGELGGETALRAQYRGGARRISPAQAQEPKQEDKVRVSASPPMSPPLFPRPGPQLDWDERPLVGSFFGREPELAQLQHWLLHEGCRLVALLGIGGVGKTALAAQLIPTLAQQFDLVLWRSLLNAPPLTELLRTLLPALSGQQLSDLPESLDQQLSLLFTYLNQGRVLLVLDNMESIMQPGAAGQYRAGYEPYRQLLAGMATRHHQGQLLLTSRERPQGLNRLERDTPLVQVLSLSGLDEAASHQLLLSRGVSGSGEAEVTLNRRYSGNPLALKLVADTVQDLFFGDLGEFLKEESLIFDDVRQVLDQQFGRLTKLEQELLFWLAVEREALPVQRLEENLLEAGSRRALLEALQGLQRRSLIEGHSNGTTPGFVLQNVIAEYLTDRLVEAAVEELETGQLELLHRHALIKAQAKEYLRQSQVRLVLNSIGEQLLAKFGRIGLIDHLRQIIARLRLDAGRARSYAGGNILNLLLQLEVDVSGYDFSRLSLWQVYLQGLSLPAVNFAGADLSGSLFSDNFGAICSLTFSPDGQLFAAATLNGEIRLWQTSGRRLVSIMKGHTDAVWCVAFSPDGKTIASGSGDQTVRLWDVPSGQIRHILRDHQYSVGAVAFSPDGKTIASGSGDQTVRLWDAESGRLRQTLDQTGWVVGLAFSPDGQILASGGGDRIVQLWDVTSGQLRLALKGHTDWVRAVAFSPDGTTLVSGSYDRTVRLWDVPTGQIHRVLEGHSNWISVVAFSADGQMVASASRDRTVRLWHVGSGQIHLTLLGHTDWVRAVAFSPKGQLLASGGYDQKVCLWNVSNGQLQQTMQGYINQVESVAFNPAGKILASASRDHAVRLWDMSASQILRSWHGHTSRVCSVAFSPDGRSLASGSVDETIRLWDLFKGLRLESDNVDHEPIYRVLPGHTERVRSVAFSPNGQILASGSDDCTVRLWDVPTGQLRSILQGHSGPVSSLTFSPDGRSLASGSSDRTIRLWEATSGQLRGILQEPVAGFRFIAFSPDGLTLASGSYDRAVRLWDISAVPVLPEGEGFNTGTVDITDMIQVRQVLRADIGRVRCVAFSPDGLTLASGDTGRKIHLWEIASGRVRRTLVGHTDWVHAVVFSADGRILTSGSADETIKVWDVHTGECLQTLQPPGPYQEMNLSGVTGLTEAQKAALKALGAVETA